MSPAHDRLASLVEAVAGHLRRRGTAALTVWLAAAVGACLLLAWFFAGGDGWRAGSEGPVLVDLLALGLIAAGVWAYRRGAAGWFAEPALADSIERVAGLDSGSVRGTLELGRSVPPGVSGALAGRAASVVLGDLNRPPRELAGRLGEGVTRWTRRGLGVLGALTVVLIGLAVAAPARTSQAWAPLSSPLAAMKDPVLPPLSVTPGSAEVLRGADLRVEIGAPGRTSVRVLWQAAGDVARSRTVAISDGRGGHVFSAVSAPIEYRVVAPDGVETERFRIVPIDPLFVSDLVVSIEYPPHTGLPPEEIRGDTPPLRLPVSSLLRIEGRASRELSTAELVDSSGSPVLRLAAGGTSFDAVWRPRVSGTFDWRFRDETGAPAEIQPVPLSLTLVPDSAPSVSIPLPGRDTILPLSLRQPLIVEARDDYGLGRLELVAYRVTAFGERMDPAVQGVDLGGTRAALARPLLDVSRWGLLPGDTVRYFARVADNAPDPSTTTTREYVLRMPVAGEMQREAEARLDEVAEELASLAQEAARQAEQNRDRAREETARNESRDPMSGERREGDLGFEGREEFRNAIEGQEELSEEVDSLRQELEALQRAMEEAGQADPDLARELEELRELLEQIAGDELRERLEQMSQALERDDLRRANESLQDLAAEQEGFRDRLEESLERFRRAAVEQDFRATTSEAEELARQERALSDALREQDAPELRAAQQQQLEDRAARLEESMERLQERLRQIEEPDAAEGVERAARESERSRAEMQEAADRARTGQSEDAAQEAQEAAEAMEQAAEELSRAQQQMQQQQAEAAQRALGQAADDALALARRQAELREAMRGATQEQTARMRGDEASLLQGVRNLADNLQEATEGSMGGNQELSAQVGRTMESMQRTIEAMESRRGATPSPYAEAEQAVSDLNHLALTAMATAEMMAQQGQGGQGGSEDVTEQLEQLAQQQGEVNSQASQLMPLQLGEQAMAQQLQQLSQGQQSVAGELGDLADRPGAREETLGDLEAMAEEADALARELQQGRLTPDLMRRQERLFHRLLDAGRSLEREEFSDERESEEPGTYDAAEVVPLTPDQLGVLRYRLPDAAQLQRLSPAVRQLVIQYFERLNHPGSSGGSGR